jgi:hypothetical protein
MANLLGRDALLAKEELEIVKVDFDNGDFVYVRQLTGHERDVFEQSLIKKQRDKKGTIIGYEQSTEDYKAKIAVLSLCDAEGKVLLRPEDYIQLSRNMSAKRLEAIASKAQEINKILEADKEEVIKNSEAVQDGNSSSDSVEN